MRYASWVGVRVAAQGDHVWIAVDDNGPGIPDDQREAVFKAFYRLEGSRNPSTGGVGLGLTIARDIVLGHGGDIELTGSAGRRAARAGPAAELEPLEAAEPR